MREIVNRLHESRQIELAKSILESAGYIVSKKLTETSDEMENHFQVGDEMEYTGVMSGLHVNQKVLKVKSDTILVEESWISEDTGNVVKDTEEYEIEQDEKGNECIVVWEYSGHLGRVYPPSREDSSCKVTESSEDIISQVKKALDDAGIDYTTRGKSEDFLLVRKEDLKRASEIRDEIDTTTTVKIGARA